MENNGLTNLEQSKRMKELGFPQNGRYFWRKFDLGKGSTWVLDLSGDIPSSLGISEYWCSAYSVNQMGIWLPVTIQTQEIKELKKPLTLVLVTGKTTDGKWIVSYRNEALGNTPYFVDEREETARASTLIHLAEKKFINPLDLK